MFVDPSGTKKAPCEYFDDPNAPPASTGYVPPKNGKYYSKEHKGYVDKYGNIWRKSNVNHGINRETGETEHWDVSTPDGNSYINVYPNGKKAEEKEQSLVFQERQKIQCIIPHPIMA